MLKQVSRRLTYANVVSTLGLFLVLTGGTAMAVNGSLPGQNTVGSADIIDNEVRSPDIADGRIFNVDIGGETITGPKVKNDTLTGADVNESTLGKVPSASSADSVNGKTAAELEGARAYAVVKGGGLCGDPVAFCQVRRSKGVAYAVHVTKSSYCVGVNGISALDPTSLAVVTPNVASPDVWARWRGAQEGNVNCVGSEFEVATGLGQNGIPADFTIVIP